MKKLLPFLLVIFFFTIRIPSVFAIAGGECDPNMSMDPQSSRPAACNLCCPRTTTTTSCATTFNLYTKIEYTGSGDKIIKKDLDFTVDPTGANVPFAGKAQDENESKYLADYLEGTNEYYANYGNQTTLTNYQGVLRKLTPYEYQNQLKKQLIARAPASAEEDKENRIHNYQVKYVGRLCWNFPFWADAGKFLIEKLGLDLPDVTHFCLYEDLKDHPGDWAIIKGYRVFSWIAKRIPLPGGKDFLDFTQWLASLPGMLHYSYMGGVEETNLSSLIPPPDPNGLSPQEYQEKFLNWKYDESGNLTKWYLLWQVVPMVSREDAIGEIKPYDGKEDPKNIVNNEDDRLEKVPHLARLFETSKIIGQTLIPAQTKVEGEIKEPPTTPDYPEINPPAECFKENYLTGEGDTLCCQTIPGKVTVEFENPLYEECHQGLENLKAKCRALPIAAKAEILACAQEIIDLEGKCRETHKQEVSQGVGVKLSHPFLDEIWQNTIYPETGFFNIFRPAGVAAFEDVPAATNISYSSSGDISPQGGSFFYPHLGGVEIAKEWVVNKVLWPFCDETISPCPKIPEI